MSWLTRNYYQGIIRRFWLWTCLVGGIIIFSYTVRGGDRIPFEITNLPSYLKVTSVRAVDTETWISPISRNERGVYSLETSSTTSTPIQGVTLLVDVAYNGPAPQSDIYSPLTPHYSGTISIPIEFPQCNYESGHNLLNGDPARDFSAGTYKTLLDKDTKVEQAFSIDWIYRLQIDAKGGPPYLVPKEGYQFFPTYFSIKIDNGGQQEKIHSEFTKKTGTPGGFTRYSKGWAID